MPEIVTIKDLAVTTGSTVNIPVDLASGFLDSMLHGYRLTGSPTLSVANYVLVPQGTAILNQRIIFYWEANVTYGVGTAITIFGKTIPSAWATKNFIATCVYDGSAWQVQLVCGGEEDGWIETADIADEAVTVDKMADLARGHLLIGNSSTRPAAVDFNNSGYIGIGDGTDYNSVAQSGDVIFSNAGVAAIQAGVIVNADVNAAAAIDVSKLAAGAVSAQILVNNVTTPTWTTVSGDATISAAGAIAIGASKITNTMMADDSVSLTNLASTGEIESLTTSTPTPDSTALTTLASILIPTGAMDTAGDVLEITAYGSTGATANNKTLTLVLGTTVLATNSTTAAPNNLNWIIEAKIFYTGAAAQKGYCKFTFNGVASEIDIFTGAETWLANTVYIKGQNGTAAVGEITLEGFQAINHKKNNS